MLRSLVSYFAGVCLLVPLFVPTPAVAELSDETVHAQLHILDRELHNVISGANAMGQPGLDGDRLERLKTQLRSVAAKCDEACSPSIALKFDRLHAVARDLEAGLVPWTPPSSPQVLASKLCSDAPTVKAGLAFAGRDGEAAWVRFQAPKEGVYRVSTVGSRGDSALAVYPACNATSAMADADDTVGLAASVSVSLAADDTIFLKVTGSGGEPIGQVLGGASISGTVTRDNDQAFPNVRVRLINLDDFSSTSTFSDAAGAYTFSGAAAGSYAVASDLFFSTYFNTAWQDVFCGFTCDPNLATPIPVADGASITGIDLHTPRGGEIAGRVRESGSLAPIGGADLLLYDDDGDLAGSTSTDGTGRYRFPGLMAGSYRLLVSDADYRPQVWPGTPCPDGLGCDPQAGDPIDVEIEQVLANINFQLDRLGAVEFEVSDSASGASINFGNLSLYDDAGNFVRSSSQFSIGGLVTGRYYAVLSAFEYQSELYEDIPCSSGCVPTDGSPLDIVEGETLRLQTSLDANGGILGRVEAAGGGPIFSNIDVFDMTGSFAGGASSSSQTGFYQVSDLPPGQYRVFSSSFVYRGESWEEIPCDSGCNMVGDLVTVTSGINTGGIDFTLAPYSTVSGTVTDSESGDPIEFPAVRIYDDQGVFVDFSGGNSDGTYRFNQLLPGTYYVTANSGGAYFGEVWDDILCDPTCDPTIGTPIVLVAEEQRDGVDFALDREPFIEGTIRGSDSGELLGSTAVSLYDDQGVFLSSDFSFDGTYRFEGLAAGTYYLYANGVDRYVGLLWSSTPCFQGPDAGCNILSGDPVVVGPAGTTADFSMPVGASLAGVVTPTSDLGDLQGSVRIYDAAGEELGTAFLRSDGSWEYDGLGAGTYFALALLSVHTDQLWNGLPCDGVSFPPCDPTTGTPIAVSLGEARSDIDFTVDRLGKIFGTLTGSASSVEFGTVDLFDATGQQIRGEGVSSNGDSFVFDGLPVGTYFLGSRNYQRHLDRIFGGETCEPNPCDPTTGTPFEITLAGELGPVDFRLDAGPGLDIQVRADYGSPVASVAIDVWTENGSYVQGVVTDASGRAVLGLSTGTYLLSTDAGAGFVDQLWQGVSCPDGPAFLNLCDLAPATPVGLSDPATLQNIEFVLETLNVVFTDGFEAGNLSAWSESMP